MARLEELEGYSVLVLAIALLAAFMLQLSVPPTQTLRAATAPQISTVLPEVAVTLAR